MYRCMIVEDQHLIKEVFESYLKDSEDFEHVVTISNASLAEMMCMTNKIDLIIMDVCTENDESGFVACSKIKKSFPKIKVIIVTSMLDCTYIQRAKDVNADSFWFKDASKIELLNLMKKTMEGEHIYPLRSPEIQLGEASSYDFTEAELRVLRLLVEGMTYKEMASELHLSPLTVKEHVRSMLAKTGFPSKTKLAAVVTSKRMIVNGF